MKYQGLEVYDAKKPLHIHVSRRDAMTGRKEPDNCAAAKAIMHEPGVLEARVFLSRMYVKKRSAAGGKPYWLRHMTPLSIRGEMIAFDRGADFTPGDYTFPPLPPSGRLGADHHKSSDTRKRHDRGKPRHYVAGIRPHGPNRGIGRSKL